LTSVVVFAAPLKDTWLVESNPAPFTARAKAADAATATMGLKARAAAVIVALAAAVFAESAWLVALTVTTLDPGTLSGAA
jgi:hypothetical protein